MRINEFRDSDKLTGIICLSVVEDTCSNEYSSQMSICAHDN